MGNGLMQVSAFDKLLSIGDYEEAYDNGDLRYVSYLNTGKLESIYSNTLSMAVNLLKIDMPNVKNISSPIFGISGSPIYSISAPKLEYLYNSAFYNCYNLSELNISTVKYIMGYSVFYSCSSLKKIYLNNCKSIHSGCFYGASNLEYVNLDRCERLERYAFSGDTQITSIELPDIKYIGDNALPFDISYAKLGLTYISVDDNILSPQQCNSISCEINFFKASFINNIPRFVNTDALSTNPCILTIQIPKATTIGTKIFSYYYSTSTMINLYANNVTIIDSMAFSQCLALKSVELNSLKYVPEGLFYRCINLEEIKLNNVISVGSNAFYQAGYNNEKLSIYLPNCTIFNATYNEVGYTDLSYIKYINLPKVSELSLYQYDHTMPQLPKNLILSNCKIIYYNNYQSDSFGDNCEIESILMPKCSMISCSDIESSIYVEPVMFLILSTSYLPTWSFHISASKIKDFGPIGLVRPDNAYFPECERGYFAIRPDTHNINLNNIKSGCLGVRNYLASSMITSGPVNKYLQQMTLSKTTEYFSIMLEDYIFDYISISNAFVVDIYNSTSIPYGSVFINECIPNDISKYANLAIINVNFVELNNTKYEFISSSIGMRFITSNINIFNMPLCSYIYCSGGGWPLMLSSIYCNTLNMPNLKNITYSVPYSENYDWYDFIRCSTFSAPLLENISVYMKGSSTSYTYTFRGLYMGGVRSLTVGLSSFKYLVSTYNIKYLSMSNLIIFEQMAPNMYNLPVNVEELHLDNCQIIKCNQYISNIRYSFNSLTYIDLPNLISIESKMIMLLPNLSYFNAPKLEYLGESAFTNCSYLTYLDLPKCSFIGDNALPSTIELVKFGYSGVVSLGSVNMNSSYTHIIQVPESLYSAYMSNPRYISLMSQGNWLITTY